MKMTITSNDGRKNIQIEKLFKDKSVKKRVDSFSKHYHECTVVHNKQNECRGVKALEGQARYGGTPLLEFVVAPAEKVRKKKKERRAD